LKENIRERSIGLLLVKLKPNVKKEKLDDPSKLESKDLQIGPKIDSTI